MKQAKVTVSFEIEEDQRAWPDEMAAHYNLRDASKTLRVLPDYAIKDGDQKQIFETIRCLRC